LGVYLRDINNYIRPRARRCVDVRTSDTAIREAWLKTSRERDDATTCDRNDATTRGFLITLALDKLIFFSITIENFAKWHWNF